MPDPSIIVFLHPDFADLPDALKEDIFDPDRLKSEGLITRELRGRGTTYFFNLRNYPCVLKHYYRGGWVSKLSKQNYVWLGFKQTRAYREWKILEELEALALPAPKRVAMRIVRSGFFIVVIWLRRKFETARPSRRF